MEPLALGSEWGLGFLMAGILLGIIEGFLPGPLMMVVVKESLQHGWKGGVKVSSSVLITDGPIILLCALLYSSMAMSNSLHIFLLLAGACVLLMMGIKTIRKQNFDISQLSDLPDHSLRNGVLTNMLNPNPYRFWTLVGAPFLIGAWTVHPVHPFLFLFGFFVCFLTCKTLISIGVGRSRDLMDSRGYRVAMSTCGVILFCFVIWFVWQASLLM